MTAKLSTFLGIAGLGLQLALQAYQDRNPTMNDGLYWAIMALSAALIVGAVAYLIWQAGASLLDKAAPDTSEAAAPGVSVIGQGNVVSLHQHGGQTAGSITNIGLQPRNLESARSYLLKRLAPYSGTDIRVGTLAFDAEARRFAAQVDDLLRAAGWNVSDHLNQTLLHHEESGVVVRTPSSHLDPALEELARAFRDAGFRASVALNCPDDEPWVVVADNGLPHP